MLCLIGFELILALWCPALYIEDSKFCPGGMAALFYHAHGCFGSRMKTARRSLGIGSKAFYK